MKNLRLFIVIRTCKASKYGIGTYIEQLVYSLENTGIKFAIINLYAEENKLTVIDKEGYTQYSIPEVSIQNTDFYFRNAAYLLRDIIPEDKNERYIFHINFMDTAELVTNLKRLFKCKTILTVHYTDWSFDLLGDNMQLKKILKKKSSSLVFFEKKIRETIKKDKKLIQKCDHLVFVAQHTLDLFTELFNIDPKMHFLINNALKDIYNKILPEQKRILRQKYHINDKTQIILFAGRLDEVKGVTYLIKAFKQVLKTNTNAQLFIAGNGDFNPLLTEANEYWSKIIFTGRLEKKQLNEFYQVADIGVVCSLHEEFGLVAVEMMMQTLPLIVTDTGGLSEIVEDNKTGLKVPIKQVDNKRGVDTDILIEKIQLLLDNPLLRSELGNNGRKFFLDKYELNIFKEKMLNLYHTI